MSALERLADRCGIQHVSEDAFGKEHVTSPETKRALLKAMHLAADTVEQAQSSFEAIEAAEWSRTLPPVVVAYSHGEPIGVPLIFKKGTATVHWTVHHENGGTAEGTIAFNGLELLETRNEPEPLERRLLLVPCDLPWGYHRLTVGTPDECSLIVSPGTCFVPESAPNHRRLWGVAAQLYLLRSSHNWGIGDFTDLRELVEAVRRNGGDAVGINPVHALFPDQPQEASPYSPSDRLLLNVLYIDPQTLPEMETCTEAKALMESADFQGRLAACKAAQLVDYDAVAGLKLPVLKLLFAAFEREKNAERCIAFKAFVEGRKPLLERACLFQALRSFFTEESPECGDCKQWPAQFRSSGSPELNAFAREHRDRVRFQLWMQWVADEQLRAASVAAEGMSVGLYRDLAVGAHPSGAEVWSYPEALVSGASVGAPPDIWNPAGQNWGLPPLHPLGARGLGYRNFIELLQANMRYAGALRIDHALALQRLYWIPSGAESKDGAYVQYANDDLIGILALESHRNRCLVIGEDLGTVPKGFRERMAKANILSYRVLFFERDEEGFIAPEAYPKLSLSVASSHDLPTLCGWWNGTDIQLKERLHLFPTAEIAEEARVKREKDRRSLSEALEKEGLLRAGSSPEVNEFCDAAHTFLARTNSVLTLFQLDDLTREEEQVNVPATTNEHPNWRRKLSVSMEELVTAEEFTKAPY